MGRHAKVILFSCLYMSGIIAFLSDYSFTFAIILAAVFALLYLYKNILSLKYLCIFTFAFIFGMLNSYLHLNYDDDLTSFADENVTVTAQVQSIPSNNFEDKTKFYALISSVETDEGIKENIKAKSLITIEDKSEKFKKIKIGDILKISGIAKLPKSAQNPPQFDYAEYLQFKNTFSLIYAGDKWEIISAKKTLSKKILGKLNDARNKIIDIHALNLKSPMLEILGGIIFGDDAVNPDEETKTSFMKSGIFHILAASGMNVSLIFGIWFFFAKNLRLNRKFSIITGMLLIIFYTCMTGFGAPVIRAALMLLLVLAGKLADRSTDTTALLFMAGLLMLVVNPLLLYDIGFQMSFLVTFGLILTSPLLIFNFKAKILNYIAGACLIPVIAQIYAAPVQMYYFNTFSLYSVFANMAIIPVLSIVSFLGFISSITALIPFLAERICITADIILNPFLIYMVKISQFFSNLPLSVIQTEKPVLCRLLLYFGFIIALTCALRKKIKSKKIYAQIALLLLLLLLTFIKIPDKNLEIIFFSVGNADCALIKSPVNDYFLIDTAKSGYKNSASAAKNIIIKYLKDKGIKNLNALILTHFDDDHAGGTIDILDNLKVKNIYITDVYENTKLSELIMKYFREKKLNPLIVQNIMNIYDINDFKINIIKPKGEKISTENQKSLIVHIKYKSQNVLFMGDGDIHSYNSLPEKYKKNIAVMKSGHHGAADTINKEMKDNTDIFIISTGINPYNHPNIKTLQILSYKKYLRTDRHNAIKVIMNNSDTKIYMYSPKFKRFIKKY